MSYNTQASPSKRNFPPQRHKDGGANGNLQPLTSSGGAPLGPSSQPPREVPEAFMPGANFQGMNQLGNLNAPGSQLPNSFPVSTQSLGMNPLNPMLLNPNVRNTPMQGISGIHTAAALGRFGGANQLAMNQQPGVNPVLPLQQNPPTLNQIPNRSISSTPPLNRSGGIPQQPSPNPLRTSTGNLTPQGIPAYSPSSLSDYVFKNPGLPSVNSFGPNQMNSYISQPQLKQSGSIPLSSSAEFPFIQTQRSGMAKSDPEFNLGGEDFPALPGVKGSAEIPNPTPIGVPPQNPHYQASMQFNKTSSFENMNPGIRAPQTVSYEQFLNRSSILQQQSKIQQKPYLPDRFGLLGLLSVIRMTDPDLNMLALGTDLTLLGLNLNSPDVLYNTFASPWADTPSRREPEFFIPPCYTMQTPLHSPISKLANFSEETLFYIFYNMPKDVLQNAAAAELFKREWRYHKELRIWLQPASPQEVSKANGVERGVFVYFDINSWEKVRQNLTIPIDVLELAPPKF